MIRKTLKAVLCIVCLLLVAVCALRILDIAGSLLPKTFNKNTQSDLSHKEETPSKDVSFQPSDADSSYEKESPEKKPVSPDGHAAASLVVIFCLSAVWYAAESHKSPVSPEN